MSLNLLTIRVSSYLEKHSLQSHQIVPPAETPFVPIPKKPHLDRLQLVQHSNQIRTIKHEHDVYQ